MREHQRGTSIAVAEHELCLLPSLRDAIVRVVTRFLPSRPKQLDFAFPALVRVQEQQQLAVLFFRSRRCQLVLLQAEDTNKVSGPGTAAGFQIDSTNSTNASNQ